MKLVYSPDARKDIHHISPAIAERINKKLMWFASQGNPLDFAEPLQGQHKVYRFRIGDYRAIFRLEKGVVIVLLVMAIKHRSEAYR